MSKYLKYEVIMNGYIVVYNKKSDNKLGIIDYYKPWKQYVFTPVEERIVCFSAGCLQEIIDKIKELKQ